MTCGGNSFNDFSENHVTKFCAVQTVLRQIGTMHFFVLGKIFAQNVLILTV